MSKELSLSPAITLINVEVTAARIEGIFLADPELGLLWRAPAMLAEACRSIALEDIHVSEGDVLARAWENHTIDLEGARGAYAVRAMLPVLANPGAITTDPAGVLGRILRVALPSEAGGEAGVRDGGPALPDEHRVIAEAAPGIGAILQAARSPVLGALRAAVHFRDLSEARLPSAERLIFLAAEHALRTLETGVPHPARRGTAQAILPPVRARWICLPSAALTRGGFRSWSPGSIQGVNSLLSGVQGELDQTLGTIPLLRRWRDAAWQHARTRHGRSRIGDLVSLAIQEPVLTTAHVRDVLGVSPRSAHNLVDEAAAQGILTCLTPRQTYRVWSTPFIADRLKSRTTRVPQTVMLPEPESVGNGLEWALPGSKRDPGQSPTLRSAAAVEEFEKAMTQADAILASLAARHRGGSETR